jgi:hypothetical protein
VQELAANGSTDLTDYDSSYICFDGFNVVAVGTGTVSGNFNVAANHTVNCVFTNVRHAHVTIVKDANPDGSQPFDFNLTPLFSNTSQSFSLFDDGTGTGNSHLSSVSGGIYTVSEDALNGWDLTNISCNAIVIKNLQTRTVTFLVLPGQNLTCTFTNTHQTGTITVNKQLFPISDSGKFNLAVDNTVSATAVGNGGTTGAVKVLTGLHTVSETAAPGTNLSDYDSSYSCVNARLVVVVSGTGTTTSAFAIAKGDNVVCTFTNQHKVVPQVLGDSTTGPTLTNTGLPIIAFTLAAMTLLGTALFVGTTRRQN